MERRSRGAGETGSILLPRQKGEAMKKQALLALGVALCLGLAGRTGAAQIQKRAPVRFSFESGNGNMNEDTGWKTLVPYWSQFRGYLLANSIPYGFTASAHLVYAFDPAEVYPGNVFQCRVWLEPADDPDIAELLLIRNRFSGARTPARLPVRVRTQTG
jgi:hypothetical protein